MQRQNGSCCKMRLGGTQKTERNRFLSLCARPAEVNVVAPSVQAVPSTQAVPGSVVARGAENASQRAAESSQAKAASDGPAKASPGVGVGGVGVVPLKGIENRAVQTGTRTAEEGVKSVLKGSQGEKAASGKGTSKTKKASFAAGTPDPTPSERHRRGQAQEGGSGATSPTSVGSRDGSSSYPPSPSSFSSLDAMLEEAADLWAAHSHNGPTPHNDNDTDHFPYSDAYSDTDTGPFRGSGEGNSEAQSVFDSFSDWDRRSLLSLSRGASASNSRMPPLGSLSAGHVTNSAASSVPAVPLAPQATAATSATDTIKKLEASAAQAASPATASASKEQPQPAPAPLAAEAVPSQPLQSGPEATSTPKAGAALAPVSQVQGAQSQPGGSSQSDAITAASGETGSSQVTPAAGPHPEPASSAAAPSPAVAEASAPGGEAQLIGADGVKVSYGCATFC